MRSVLMLLVLLSVSSLVMVRAGESNCSALLKSLRIPADIAVPAGHTLKEAYYAEGLQHYVFNGSAWVNFNATATLYSVQGKSESQKAGMVGGRKLNMGEEAPMKKYAVGQHFFLGHPDAAGGQPSWETVLPAYSLVTARSVEAVTVDPRSVTWNLFEATSHSGSTDVLGAVTYLQRLASKGGLPPATALGARFGDIHVTPFSIIYAFYVKEN